ncbi:MAG: hypothetical protein KF691_09655 [Phycisphaeraceae bacterium]|nr:hypothetical protein [Phycisphaeraceae bacterium]
MTLDTPGAANARVNGAAGNTQGGDIEGEAGIWSGTAQSWVNLQPSFATSSTIFGVSENQQGGRAAVPFENTFQSHACLWRGSAASWVDLHPSVGDYSQVNAVAEPNMQGGYFSYPNQIWHAALWRGTKASFVDLNPAGATASEIRAMTATQQGGTTRGASGNDQAALWSGTAQSVVSLHSGGNFGSAVNGMVGDMQVGSLGDVVGLKATMWKGTAASRHNLHQYLPSNYKSSFAMCIWTDGISILIGGSGTNMSAGGPFGRNEAVLWVWDGCRSDFNRDNVVDDSDFAEFVSAYDELLVPPANPQADLNHDAQVDDADFVIFVAAYDQFECD